jgi:hypothetical protein
MDIGMSIARATRNVSTKTHAPANPPATPRKRRREVSMGSHRWLPVVQANVGRLDDKDVSIRVINDASWRTLARNGRRHARQLAIETDKVTAGLQGPVPLE